MPCGVAWFTKNERASGNASASNVTILMPLSAPCAARSRCPPCFPPRPRSTSTAPSVIQFSTISFCFAAWSRSGRRTAIRRRVPSRLCRRRPLHEEVGVALAFGRHRDHELGIGLRRHSRAVAHNKREKRSRRDFMWSGGEDWGKKAEDAKKVQPAWRFGRSVDNIWHTTLPAQCEQQQRSVP